MPIKVRRQAPLAVAAVVAAFGLAALAALYTTSPAPPEATLAERLTAGPGRRSAAAIAAMIGLIWGASSLVAAPLLRRQLAEIDEAARRMGMGMKRVTEPSDLTEPGLDLPVLRRSMEAVIRGKHEGADVLIGRYTVGSETKYGTAVACFRLPRELPVFVLAPEGISDKLESALGAADLDFATHPEFSSAYRLRSSDEPGARALFSNPSLLDRLVRDKGWYAECNGNWLGLHRLGEAVPRAALPEFLQRATPLFQALIGR